MLSGYSCLIISNRYPPFYDNEPIGIYKKILSGLIEFPKFFDSKVRDLIKKLLNPEHTYRLGVHDVKLYITPEW